MARKVTGNSKGQSIKELAIFGLRKIFVDPAPRPRKASARMQNFFDPASLAGIEWLPE